MRRLGWVCFALGMGAAEIAVAEVDPASAAASGLVTVQRLPTAETSFELDVSTATAPSFQSLRSSAPAPTPPLRSSRVDPTAPQVVAAFDLPSKRETDAESNAVAAPPFIAAATAAIAPAFVADTLFVVDIADRSSRAKAPLSLLGEIENVIAPERQALLVADASPDAASSGARPVAPTAMAQIADLAPAPEAASASPVFDALAIGVSLGRTIETPTLRQVVALDAKAMGDDLTSSAAVQYSALLAARPERPEGFAGAPALKFHPFRLASGVDSESNALSLDWLDTLEPAILTRRLDVSGVQEALNARGYEAGRVDGLFGRRTRNALIACLSDRCRLPLDDLWATSP